MAAQTHGSAPQSGRRPFSSPPPSHEFDEQLLDEAQLRLHFSGLRAHAEHMYVSFKRSTETRSEAATLEELVLPLVKRTVFGAQVEYSSRGRRWLDTFIATTRGVRFVRVHLAG